MAAQDERVRRLIGRLQKDVGEVILAAMQASDTLDVMVNGTVAYVERRGAGMVRLCDAVPDSTVAFMRTLAGYYGLVVDERSPILECTLPWDGSRFAGALPPIVEAPIFSVRRRAASTIRLRDYVESGALSPSQLHMIQEAIGAHKNIIVAGGTGSGKTTLVNALIAEIVRLSPANEERPIILEDTPEIQCDAPNCVNLFTSSSVSMAKLVHFALRLRPRRVFVGEVRGQEALDLIMAWSTGHGGGAATVHADSAQDTLLRLRSLVSMSPYAPRDHLDVMIRKAVDVVVYIERTSEGRRVREVLSLDEH